MRNFVSEFEIITGYTMGNIKIIKGVFNTKQELKDVSVMEGFPSSADDYRHKTVGFSCDYKSEGYIEMQMS